MANYSSYKVYIEQVIGTFDVEVIKENVRQLQKGHRLIYDIQAYICPDKYALELRYSAKWFPNIDEIFLPDEYDIWLIYADEGGARDSVSYFPFENSRIEKLDEKKLCISSMKLKFTAM